MLTKGVIMFINNIMSKGKPGSVTIHFSPNDKKIQVEVKIKQNFDKTEK